MNNPARQWVFNPKEPLFPPDTPMADFVIGSFRIDFARSIPNPEHQANFAPTIFCYRIHRVTNFAEVVFEPPPSKISARYGHITADPRIGTKPIMDEEQRIRMVETTLVAVFDYMLDIIEQQAPG
ncbi:hypothetical protein GGF32_005733 [Allomyces javanicus]|nr:hypothetical protein GGF32_005733 [Allomyces javanicus]